MGITYEASSRWQKTFEMDLNRLTSLTLRSIYHFEIVSNLLRPRVALGGFGRRSKLMGAPHKFLGISTLKLSKIIPKTLQNSTQNATILTFGWGSTSGRFLVPFRAALGALLGAFWPRLDAQVDHPWPPKKHPKLKPKSMQFRWILAMLMF